MKKTVIVDLEERTISLHIEDLLIEDITNLSAIVQDIADNVKNTFLISKRHKSIATSISSRLLETSASQERPPEDP